MTHIGPHPLPEMYEPGLEIDCQCARCGSSIYTERCDQCEDGYDGHDCGEDLCCCRHPEENVPCDWCNGTGVWRTCISSEEWCQANPLTGREEIKRGEIEWFTVKEKE